SEDLTRRLLHAALAALPAEQQTELFPAVGLAKWARKLGLGSSQAQERTQWLLDSLARPLTPGGSTPTLRQICEECHLESAAGIVQVMHQIGGICFLVFAERGLWNRFVPSLDGYIQDRLNNPVHIPGHGTIKALRLEAPPADLVRRVVEARLKPVREELGEWSELPSIFPFSDDELLRIARTEPTLRDMLQQY